MKLNPSNISIIKRLLVGRSNRPLRTILLKFEPGEIASIFSVLDRNENRRLMPILVELDLAVNALLETPDPILEGLLKDISEKSLVKIFSKSRPDQSADLLTHIPQERADLLLEQLHPKIAKTIRQYLAYPEDSAGRLMQTSFFSLLDSTTAEQGLELLRQHAQNESIYYIYCTDAEQRLTGVVSLRQLATAPKEMAISNLRKPRVVTVSPFSESEEVARLIGQYNFVALPVIDESRHILGLVTVDDIVDIIQEQATSEIYAQAGLQEDDRIYTPIQKSVKNRIPWMFLNLGLASIASWVISLFEETLSQTIILASLINIIAGMGGNTAIQTLTVVTRGLAVGDFSFTSAFKAIIKEASVGLINGFFTGIGAALLIYIWKGHLGVSVVIGISMPLNALIAATMGACVPLILDKLKLDPAAGSGVLVTTLTDMFSFFSFLGIATILLQFF
ncbi:MAG: magnesium transporter [Bdellovibrionales bacterium]|nr:magnesium transporter [Bdellovibrionales bacterium]